MNAQGGDEQLLLAGVVCMLKQRKKQRSWCRAQRAAEELVGAVPATKTHGGGRGWKLRSRAKPFIPSMQREVNRFLSDDGVPWWGA